MITQFKVKVEKVQETPGEVLLDTAMVCREFFRNHIESQPFFDAEKEHLVVLILNTKLKIKGWNLVSIGTNNSAEAHPREIFRPVIAMSGYAFILMHNHPSGDPTPSQADHRLTRQIRDASQMMQINILDHVIAGQRSVDGSNPDYFSFREAGCI